MKPHVHADLIKKWADGAEIQVYQPESNNWITSIPPHWYEHRVYRVKPTTITIKYKRYLRIFPSHSDRKAGVYILENAYSKDYIDVVENDPNVTFLDKDWVEIDVELLNYKE